MSTILSPSARRCRLAATVAAAALMVASFAACDPGEPTPTPTPTITTASSTTPTPTPTPTSTPSGPSQEEKEKAAIRQSFLDYEAVRAKVGMDTNADINQLKKVAGGELLETDLGKYREWRAKGWRATKAGAVENLTVGSVTTGTAPAASATYCANSTGVDVVDRQGKSQVVKGRPNFFSKVVSFVKGQDGRWLPVRQRDGGDACAGR